MTVATLLGAVGAVDGLKFKQIGIAQGLSHATVAAIAQDSVGYMWIATPDGLNRYDGYSFKVYRSSDRPGSIPANSLRHIDFDNNGNMWVAAAKSLSRYDASADSFENFYLDSQAEINDFLPMDDGTLLVGSSLGLYVFDPATGTFSRSDMSYRGRAVSLAKTSAGIYIAAGPEGLLLLPDGSSTPTRVPLPDAPFVKAVLPDGDDTLMIATEGHGLLRYNVSDGTVYAYRAGSPEGLGSDYVRSMARDSHGRLWVGTFNGLAVLDADGRRFSLYDVMPESTESLSHASVRCIYPDHQGGMWLGTFFGGLNYYHPLKNQFQTLRSMQGRPSINDNVISRMTEDSRGDIWIGTNNGGLNRYRPSDGSFAHFTKADGLGSNDIKAIYIDSPGRIYVGSHLGGMNILDPATGHITSVDSAPENVFDIIAASRPGHLWMATLDALLLYDKSTGRTETVPAGGLHRITDLYRDGAGHLWVAGEDGVVVFDEDSLSRLSHPTGLPDHIPGRNTTVYNVYRSRSGSDFWISTAEGLHRISADSGLVSHYTTADGLPNDIVYGVLEDASGSLWCSTNFGIAVLNPETGAIRSYSARDGLQSNQFMPKSYLRSSDGYLYFGGVNGLTYFNPSVLNTNPYSPAPVISGLRLYNRPVTPGDDTGILSEAIMATDGITLGPNQRVLSIDFTVCNYVAGDHNTFSYKLEGLDKEWTTIDGAGSATYSNLPAGKYRFVIRAANNDGVWCNTETGLDITVMPVWYRRWWAVMLFVIVGAAVALGVVAVIYRRKVDTERRRLESLDLERQRELNEMKVRFFINMSHELRTPLTLILLPVQELLQRATDLKMAQKLELVKNNAERILHIVNQLLDYRRAELGMFRLKVEEVDLNELMRKISANYSYQARRRGINYRLDSTLKAATVLCDPQYIELICNNLISNAFKYTPRGQDITVQLSATPAHEVVIKVADTGCGIPADKLEQIFTRFYQVNDRAGGNGIGLSLVKRLVELHHGTIAVESELGKGTTFTVTLPATDSAFTADEHASENTAPLSFDILKTSPVVTDDYIDTDDADTSAPTADTDRASAPDEGAADKRQTILVVDDNPDILKYICEHLAEQYRVIPAADGAKAIEIMSRENIDLIITDIMMPDIDGMQLCRTIKRNLRTSHIPVIMLSAKSDVADQLGGLKVGADDYIAKPFSMEVLAAKIRNQLRTRSQAIRHYAEIEDVEPETVAINPLDEEFLRKALDVMERHLDDSQFSTDIFAREMCMSRSNLHLKMKALTGESTNDFIRRYRMRQAMNMLKSGRYTVSEVSAMVGYGTPSYFATSFKKFFGALPSEYIKKE